MLCMYNISPTNGLHHAHVGAKAPRPPGASAAPRSPKLPWGTMGLHLAKVQDHGFANEKRL